MIDKINQLEKQAKLLEPDSSSREQFRQSVVTYTEHFLNTVNEINAYNSVSNKGKAILDSPISEEPTDIKQLIDLVEKNVDYPGLNPASGGHLGYIPGGGIYTSALGDYMADVTNRYSGIFFASPGAVRMENMLINWMGKIIGWQPGFAGNLTSGGSIANLIAVVTARDAKNINSSNITKSVIYATEQAHHSIHKAIRIAGLGECILRSVPVDDHYRMKADALRSLLEKDKQDRLNPFLVIASAGTTDVGAVDPLSAIGDIAQDKGLWYHIDAAYGGFFVLVEEGKQKLQGIGKADSVIMDPHKGLFLPYGTGAVLVKDTEALNKSHYYLANYMQDTLGTSEEPSPADLSPELTKHFRGMRLWLPLKLHGLAPFRACLEEKLWLTRYFYEEIQKIEGFEVGHYPELSVATFRYVPENEDANTFNKRLVEAIHKDGRVFLSSTMLNGVFTIRLAVLSFRTHLSTINLTLQVLKEKVAEL